ncbi:MAG: acyl-CoA thioesterase [Verrucomicrobiae bacterium]|nr:acyl-CoA thioesterase [Verrucomicrobiae bacterium]
METAESELKPIFSHSTQLRVRYSETDQMGTFYNARAFEWFECGRTELLRAAGLTYSQLEALGFFLPVVEAYARFLGRAKYDDLLNLQTSMFTHGKSLVKMQVDISNAETGKPVVSGYTIHVFTNKEGRPVKPPSIFYEKFKIQR